MNTNNQTTQHTTAGNVPEIPRIEQHKALCRYLTDTYEKKNADYGNSFGDMFAELGIITAITRIGDKYNRIKTLAKNQMIHVKGETVTDTLLDMANYCIMTVIEIAKQNAAQTAEKEAQK